MAPIDEEPPDETPANAGDTALAAAASGASLFGFEEVPGPAVIEGPADEAQPGVIEGAVDEAQPAASPVPGGLAPGDSAGAGVQPGESLVRDALKELGADLARRLDALQSLFERELRAEETRERVIDRLHAELQEYKQDLLLKVQRPIFIDLIQLHDDIGKMIETRSLAPEGGDESAAFRRLLESIQIAIEDILYRQGVEPFTVQTVEFDPRRQRAISTRPTDDPALNKTVASRVRKGFQAGLKLIRPEMVAVYTLRQPPPEGQA